MYVIFYFLLSVAHFLCNLYYLIQHKWLWLSSTVKQHRFFHKIYESSIVNSNERLFVSTKIPKHLAILLGQEEISYLDLVRLISWCIFAEIPYVSFYDHEGNLQKNQRVIEKKLKELEPHIIQNIEWLGVSDNITDGINVVGPKQIKNNNFYANVINADATNIINKSKTRIQLLSYADGKDKIVGLTKQLANLSDTNGFLEHNVTPELLEERLNFYINIPDPDLAIVFGETMCTYGFLPWHTRVTEFFLLPTHHNVSSNSFIETLIKFSECQQRYGK